MSTELGDNNEVLYLSHIYSFGKTGRLSLNTTSSKVSIDQSKHVI